MKKFDVFYVVLGIPTIMAMFYWLVIEQVTKGDFWGSLWALLLLVVNVGLVSDSLHAILTSRRDQINITVKVEELKK